MQTEPAGAEPAGTEPTGSVTPLLNPTDADLRAAQETNLFELFRAMATLNGGVLSEDAHLSMHTAFPNSPMFSGIWNAHIPADEVDTEITRALDWMRMHGARSLFWWISAGTQPTSLGEQLVHRGFIANFVADPCLAIALDQLSYATSPTDSMETGSENTGSENTGSEDAANAGYAGANPPETQARATLVIEEAITTNTLNDWRQVYRAAQELPDFTVHAYLDAIHAFPTDAVPWRAFVGYANEKPVCAAMLIPGAGIASIYGLGTLHTARGKGFGAVLARHIMEVARDMGFTHVVTFSTPDSVHFFENLGFHLLNTTISRYLYFFAQE